MHFLSLSHLADGALRRDMVASLTDECCSTARAVAHIAEFDARRLYAPEGYSSMHRFCVEELHLSEDAASKRIHAARAARRFPAIYDMLADGRLHLSAVCLLAPRLSEAVADELLRAAVHRSKREIERYLAGRFPKEDVAARVAPLAPAPASPEQAPGHAAGLTLEHAPGHVQAAPRAKVAPLAPERYAVQFTIGQGTHEMLAHLEQLLGHRLSAHQMEQVFAHGLQALAAKIEKRRFAATDRPRRQRRAARGRHIPAEVRRQVLKRDQGRCTFVAENGRRCEARGRLEFDHIEPVARGGISTVENLRLRCRAHNQYEAERLFGAGFMHEKRERSRPVASARAAQPGAAKRSATAATSASTAPIDARDVTPWLTRLGFRTADVRRAAAHCEHMTGATLEERIRAALSFLSPPARVHGPGAPRVTPGP